MLQSNCDSNEIIKIFLQYYVMCGNIYFQFQRFLTIDII